MDRHMHSQKYYFATLETKWMDFILLYSVLQHTVLVIDDIRVEFRFNHRLLNCAVQLGAMVGGTSLF